MSESQWTDAAPLDEVPAEDVIGKVVAGREIALYSVDGGIYATDNLCTHGHARLCEGFLDGHEIECPLHQGSFHIPTGKCLKPPARLDLKTYPIRIEGGHIYVGLPVV